MIQLFIMAVPGHRRGMQTVNHVKESGMWPGPGGGGGALGMEKGTNCGPTSYELCLS